LKKGSSSLSVLLKAIPVSLSLWERVGVRVRLESIPNRLQNTFRFLQHVTIPEPQHANSLTSQLTTSLDIASRQEVLSVTATVHLNGKLRFDTIEVEDVNIHRMLPTELESSQLPVPKKLPKPFLGIGTRSTQFTTTLQDLRRQGALHFSSA